VTDSADARVGGHTSQHGSSRSRVLAVAIVGAFVRLRSVPERDDIFKDRGVTD
jgi:hypothetical protein